MPRTPVRTKPEGSRPGVTSLAMTPTTRPNRIHRTNDMGAPPARGQGETCPSPLRGRPRARSARKAGDSSRQRVVLPYGPCPASELDQSVTTVAPPRPLLLSMEDLPGPAFVLEGPEGRVSWYNA